MKIMMVRDRNVLNTNWLVYLANLFASNNHDVIIACDTYSKLGKTGVGYDLDTRVRVINLNAKTKNRMINAYRFLREKVFVPYFRFNKLIKREKPDILLSYFPVDLYNITRFQNHKIPIIQMVHGEPSIVFKKYLKANFLKKFICRKSFAKVHTFQVLMNSFEKTMQNIIKTKNIVRIANPVKQYRDNELVDLNNEKKKIIYVARVEKKIKRPHLLIEAFAKIAKDFPDWKVEIWGLAKYEDYNNEINNFITEHHLENQVCLAGYAQNMDALYKSADIHAFPSKSEGFSLAIADAMSIGLPHIGFSDADSVNEIIIDGHNGFLVNDIDEFAEKLKILISKKDLRIEFGKNANVDMREYAPAVLVDKWNKLFNRILKENK